MARVIMNGPPPGRYCVACLMEAKQKHWEMSQHEREAAYAAPASDKPAVIAWPAALDRELAEGPYRAVWADAPALGIIDLCWGHVAGINPTTADVPVLDKSTRIPPGLLKNGGR